MKIKLVTDSSANIHPDTGLPVTRVPLKIVTSQKEYADDASLNVLEMMRDLRAYRGTSGTACPGVGEWLEAFEDADVVFGVAITSNLSGCYGAANVAAQEYMAEHPGKKVFILDSLSTGPEMQLILEKYQELIAQGKDFETIRDEVVDYHKRTHLLFSLGSLNNLARNGRVNPAVAKAAGLLGIRVVGKASDHGTLEPMHKCRGEKRALEQIFTCMKEHGYAGGKVRITHSENLPAAQELSGMVGREFPGCDVAIAHNGGLCCFYAEEGSILVGYEG